MSHAEREAPAAIKGRPSSVWGCRSLACIRTQKKVMFHTAIGQGGEVMIHIVRSCAFCANDPHRKAQEAFGAFGPLLRITLFCGPSCGTPFRYVRREEEKEGLINQPKMATVGKGPIFFI